MTRGSILNVAVALIATIALAVALNQAEVVFAPFTLAVFIVALVWPMQRALQRRIPALAALFVTITVTAAVMLAFASLLVWGFGRVGRTVIADAGRYQTIYDAVVAWLENHDVSVAGLWAQHFNVSWMLRWAQQITGRLNTTLTFWLGTLIYVIFGLMEIDNSRRKVETYLEPDTARVLLSATADAAYKFRRYMLVRTQMSFTTGVLFAAFTWAVGLHFAAELGVIAFALNYIPLIGPFVTTLFATLLAIDQLTTWEAVLGVFICLNVIQFVVGSYVEPLVSGSVLAISPTLVVFAIFFWTFLWGLYGTFIGVPIAIAVLTFCRHCSSSQRIADLFGGPVPEEREPDSQAAK